MKYIFCFFSFILSYHTIFAQIKSDAICGTWFTKDQKAQIEIYASQNQFEGKIIWIKNPKNPDGSVKKDTHNPDKSLQSSTILGSVLLKGFKFKDNIWEDGSIYDPESGNTYSGQIKMLTNETIEIRGFLGISVFGRSETWTRVKK